MKCTECDEYVNCGRENDLRRKRSRCPKAKKPKPITNYDRIISKTPEELAEFLCKNREGCRALTTESYVCDYYDDNLNTDCHKCWLDWLKQEVEDDD